MQQITPCGHDPGMTGTNIGVSSIKREEKTLQVAAIKRLITHILERRLLAMATRSRKINPLHLLDWELTCKSRRNDAQSAGERSSITSNLLRVLETYQSEEVHLK